MKNSIKQQVRRFSPKETAVSFLFLPRFLRCTDMHPAPFCQREIEMIVHHESFNLPICSASGNIAGLFSHPESGGVLIQQGAHR
jgi:hypothetical protein